MGGVAPVPRPEQVDVAHEVPDPVKLRAVLVDRHARRVVGEHVGPLLLRVEREAVQDQPPDAAGMGDGDLAGDVGAGVAAIEVEAPDAQPVQRAEMRVGEIGDGRRLARRRIGIAVAQRVGGDHAARPAEGADQRLQHLRRARRGMQHHQRRAGAVPAGRAEVHLALGHLGEAAPDGGGGHDRGRRGAHEVSSRGCRWPAPPRATGAGRRRSSAGTRRASCPRSPARSRAAAPRCRAG